MLAPVVGVRQPVEQLDQVLHKHRHLVGALTVRLADGGWWLERPDLHRLRAAAAFRHPELHPLPGPENRPRRRQGSRVHEDLTTVITGEEAEPLLGVIPLDLASRHEPTLYAK